MAEREIAIVFGVGPGLGWALARRFATENIQVGAVARDEEKLNTLIAPESPSLIGVGGSSCSSCLASEFPCGDWDCPSCGC